MRMLPAWLRGVVAVGASAGVAAGCNVVLGLNNFKDCPQDVPCPGTGGKGAGSTSSTSASSTGSGGMATSSSMGSGGMATSSSMGSGGMGGCTSPSDCSAPSACLQPTCTARVCGSTNAPAGASCTGDGGAHVCDGNGNCVECTVPTESLDCTITKTCVRSVCAPESCFDGTTGNGETDVDCGGPCPGCAFGRACIVDTDCMSGYCNPANNTCDAVTLAMGQQFLVGIAIDATSVYWTDWGMNMAAGSGSVMKQPINGGMAVALASMEDRPSSIAVNGSNVFWTNNDGAGSVRTTPIGGGTVATFAPSQAAAISLVLDATNAYWATFDDGTVMQKPLVGGGSAITLAIGQSTVNGVAVDATNVYWTLTGTLGMKNGSIMTTPIGGGNNGSPIAAGQDYPGVVVVNSTKIYWSAGNVNVMTMLVGGGSPAQLYSLTGMGSITSLVLDANNLYCAYTGAIVRVPLDGSKAVVLATGVNARGMAVDATSVYWTTSDGYVRKMLK